MVDLETPQHFTKEQSEWIKQYVIIKKAEAQADARAKIITMLNAYCESLEAEDVKWRKPYVLGIRHSIELIEEIYK